MQVKKSYFLSRNSLGANFALVECKNQLLQLFPSPKNHIIGGPHPVVQHFKDFNSSVVLFWKTSNTRFNKTDKLPFQISLLSTIIRLLGNDRINQDLSDWNF